jgi:transcriptional regulator with XRE-family HTH domain
LGLFSKTLSSPFSPFSSIFLCDLKYHLKRYAKTRYSARGKTPSYTGPVMPRKSKLKLPPLKLGNESLGQRLARLRKERGITQVDLAKKIGLIQSLISAYEHDRLRLSAEMAVRFALALGISTDELLHPKNAAPAGKTPSRKVRRRMKQIESLPPRQQAFVLTTLDVILKGALDQAARSASRAEKQ